VCVLGAVATAAGHEKRGIEFGLTEAGDRGGEPERRAQGAASLTL